MTSREFCYWLQGYFELHADNLELRADQTKTIAKHLNMVFEHEIDKSYPNQPKLNQIHNSDPNKKMRC